MSGSIFYMLNVLELDPDAPCMLSSEEAALAGIVIWRGRVIKHRAGFPYDHYQHPEFYESVEGMSFIDIIEMVLDWKAAADTYKTQTFRDGIDYQIERQGFTRKQQWLIREIVEWVDPQ